MINSRGLKQVTKHFFFLLQITETCPSIHVPAKEEIEEEEKIEIEGEGEEKVEVGAEEEGGGVGGGEEEENGGGGGEIEEAVPSGVKVTSAGHHNKQACRWVDPNL